MYLDYLYDVVIIYCVHHLLPVSVMTLHNTAIAPASALHN